METHFQSKTLGVISSLPKQLGVLIPPNRKEESIRLHISPRMPFLPLDLGPAEEDTQLFITHVCDPSEITVGPALTFHDALW